MGLAHAVKLHHPAREVYAHPLVPDQQNKDRRQRRTPFRGKKRSFEEIEHTVDGEGEPFSCTIPAGPTSSSRPLQWRARLNVDEREKDRNFFNKRENKGRVDSFKILKFKK